MLIFILFKLCIFPPLFYIKVYAVGASKLLIRFANKCSTFHNYLFLILYWFLVLYTYLNFVSYLLFYIRHIAWCIFIRFVNKSSMLYFVVDAELPLI